MRGAVSDYPFARRGIVFLLNTPEADRSAQVPGVQSAGSPCSSELQEAVSGCGCAGLSTSRARSMNKKLFFSCAGDARQQFALGLATEGRVDAFRLEPSGRMPPAGETLAPAAQAWAMAEVLLQPVDISFKAVHGSRRAIEVVRSTEAPQFSTSADFRVVGSSISAVRKALSALPEPGCVVSTAVSEE